MRRGALGLALLAAVLAVAGCGSSNAASNEMTTLKIGYGFGADANDGADPIGFGILANRFGIHLKQVDFGSATDAIVALDRGDLQIANVGQSQAVPAIQAGAKIRLVLPSNALSEFALVARGGITTPGQLRGMTVLISSPQGSTASFVKQVISRGGVPLGSVRFPAIRDSSDRIVALEHGRADAALLDQLDIERLRLAGKPFTILGRIRDIEPVAPSTCWAISEAFIKAHPEEVQHFVNAMTIGYREIYAPAGRRSFLRTVEAGALKGADPRLAERMYAWYNANRYWPGAELYTRQRYDKLMTYWTKRGAIDGTVPPYDQVWDTLYWERALEATS
jgi:ABC-type nitrate/sulfonate/bicarbonate transport system substrate-binding protein